jgi:hypothetical protein
MTAVVFAACIAPTIVSYRSYTFWWDDSSYLGRAVEASRAIWSMNLHNLRLAMVSIRPPVMTFLGVPWGPLNSWDAAGKCFVSLTSLTAFFAAVCLFLLLRSGMKPVFIVIGSICAFAAMGPYPDGATAHRFATGFMADSLFAWIAFAATLLIPYEAMTSTSSIMDSILRGLLWGVIFSIGAITKVSYFYFLILIIPILFLVRTRRNGLRNAVLALMSLGLCLLPIAIYWLRFGLPALRNGWRASFGRDAAYFNDPFPQFVSETIRQSPGIFLSIICVVAAITYMSIKRRDLLLSINILPLLIMIGFLIIGLASKNREIRFMFAGIIAPPFLAGLLLSGKDLAFSRKSAAIAGLLAFCCLSAAGLPMMHRANQQSIQECDAVITQAVKYKAKSMLLASDSASLNGDLMRLAISVSPAHPSIVLDTLAWSAVNGVPIENDFNQIQEYDLVAIQNNPSLAPPFANERDAAYEQYAREHAVEAPITVGNNISVFIIHRNSP